MPDFKYKYEWSSKAKVLLGMRDRFTRSAIQKDFEQHADRNKVTLDADSNLYATPVADDRYAVIWQLSSGDQAEVKAVVASQLRGEAGASLKTKLEKVMAAQSNGQFKLI